MALILKHVILLYMMLIASATHADTTMTRAAALQIYSNANTAYQQQKFEDARNGYQQLVNSGIHSADVFYNLANASARVGKRGEAIAWYRRALKLSPRDEDAKANLKRLLPAASTDIPGLPAPLSRLAGALSMREWAMLMLAILYIVGIFGVGLLALKQQSSRRRFRIPFKFAIVCLVLVTPCFLLRYYSDHMVRAYTVIEDGASVRSGPAERFAQEAVQQSGSLLTGQDYAENGWISVKLRDGRKGYIRERDVVPI